MRPALRARLRRLRMVILDVDGVLTDGGMYYSERGEALKKFNTKDGQGIRRLHEAGIRTALVTGETTAIVTHRAAKLQIEDVYQGATDKLSIVKALLEKHGIRPEEACYVGDDLGDLEAMTCVGVAVAVADAAPAIRRIAHFMTRRRGGEGAVREVCELILSARLDPGAAGRISGSVKGVLRRFVPERVRRLIRTARTPRRERYAPDEVERVKSVTSRHWQTMAGRSARYVAGYWDHADDARLHTRASRRSEWFAALPVFAGAESVMELGCASGRNLYLLQQRYPGMALHGIDINPEAIDHARGRVRGDFRVGDLYDMERLLAGVRVDLMFTMGALIHVHPAALPELIREMTRHARTHLVFCEQCSETDEVVKGPAWWRPSRKVTGDYIQWSPNLRRLLSMLGLPFELSDVPGELQSNGARHLVVVRLP
jgi:YrbI family 3-deoxy-D-manno-octulosonate 8-phosphate phosphatase